MCNLYYNTPSFRMRSLDLSDLNARSRCVTIFLERDFKDSLHNHILIVHLEAIVNKNVYVCISLRSFIFFGPMARYLTAFKQKQTPWFYPYY
jgi:hypothetical protein